MISIELFPCCLKCEYADLELDDSPEVGFYDPSIGRTVLVDKSVTVSCKHWPVCNRHFEDKEKIYISDIVRKGEGEKNAEN